MNYAGQKSLGRATKPPILSELLRLPGFSRLWRAMLVSSLGDWIGFVAIASIVTRIGGDRAGYAVAGVMLARLLPSILLGPFAGILVDRLDRRRLMMAADLVRFAAHLTMPFLGSLPAIYALSFVVESMSLIWAPSRDASVPDLVPRRQILNASTMVLATSYATLPISGLVFTGLTGVGVALGARIEFFADRPEAPALFVDSLTFLFSAWMVRGISFGSTAPRPDRAGGTGSFAEMTAGVRFMARHVFARAMTIGIVSAFAGAGCAIALGPIFARDVLRTGPSGWGILVTALGIGMTSGMFSVRFLDRVLHRRVLFIAGTTAAAAALFGLAVTPNLITAAVAAGLMGLAAGVMWVSGYTLLQENVPQRIRGRVFASLALLVRLGLFVSLSGFPALSEALGQVLVGGGPGGAIRLALILGAGVVLAGGIWSRIGLAKWGGDSEHDRAQGN